MIAKNTILFGIWSYLNQFLGKRNFSDPKKLESVFFKWLENIKCFGEKKLWCESTSCINFQRYVSFLFTWLAMWANFLIKKYFDNYCWKIQLIVRPVGDVGQLSYSKIFRRLLLKNITTWLAMWACSCFLLVYCTFANLRILAFKKLDKWYLDLGYEMQCYIFLLLYLWLKTNK